MSLMLEPAREGRLKLQNTSGKPWFGVGMGRPSFYPNQPASLIFTHAHAMAASPMRNVFPLEKKGQLFGELRIIT